MLIFSSSLEWCACLRSWPDIRQEAAAGGTAVYRDSVHYFRSACYEIEGTLYAVTTRTGYQACKVGKVGQQTLPCGLSHSKSNGRSQVPVADDFGLGSDLAGLKPCTQGGQRDAVLFRDLVESKQRRVLSPYALSVVGCPVLFPATERVDSTVFSKIPLLCHLLEPLPQGANLCLC